MHLYAYLYLLQWAQLHTCDKDLDWLICLGLLLALADSLQNMADHFVFQAASKPAFEEANMHQRAAAQPGCAPHRWMCNPPSLYDATTSCSSASDTGLNLEHLEHCCNNSCYSSAPFQLLLKQLPLGVLQAMERVGRVAWGYKTVGSSRYR
jgi:hypothetical protein